MTQIGEGIAVKLVRLEEGKCIFCGKAEHENKKKDEIKPTGWVAHPGSLSKAERYVKDRHDLSEITYPSI